MKLKKNDTVKVLKGKDKGKTGNVEAVLLKADAVLVLGVNQYKRHLKSRVRNQKSEIVTITKPLSVSSVVFVCPKCTKTVRLGYKMMNDKKVRVCKKCGEAV